MNPIDAVFQLAARENRKAFIPFVTAGDPDPDGAVEVARTLAVHGASLIEIGFPYSDPIADGPVIQASYTRALARGLKLDDVFDCVRHIASLSEVKGSQIPLAAMTSFSLVHRRGFAETFLNRPRRRASAAPSCPTCPSRKSEALADLAAARRDFKLIQLVTPTTPGPSACRRHRPAARPASSTASA